MSDRSAPSEIFCLYAPEDEHLFQDLKAHLSSLKQQGLITLWHDHLILPGSNQEQAITAHLEGASLILLLISAHFIESDHCRVTMTRALQRQNAKEARVIPILLRPVDYQGAPFEHLVVLPTDAKPLTNWPNRDAAFADIATGIRRALGDLSFLATSTSHTGLPAIWGVPYRRNSFFSGRDEILSRLHTQLQSGQVTALSQLPVAMRGLSGIGKTQIAVEYAYRYHQEYEVVLWAHAESKETLTVSYNTIADLLQLPGWGAQKQEMIIQAVKNWLQTHGRWLLILDNAEDLEMVQSFLPLLHGGHILLTTKAQMMGGLALNIDVDTLDDEQGALFLLRRATIIGCDTSLEQASIEDRQLSTKIAHELGGLPLALDQAGAYLEETGASLEQYLQVYQHHRTALFKRRGGLGIDQHEPVATTWSLSFQRVEEKSLAAAELLQFCAYLAPDAIVEEIITQGASFLGSVLSVVAADPFLFNQAIEVLRAYSLVRRDSKANTLSTHRLVQAVLRDDMAAEAAKQWKQRAVQAVKTTIPKVEQWDAWERYLPHALVCATWIEQEQMTFPAAIHLLKATGLYLRTCAQYAQARRFLERALALDEHMLGRECPEIAIDLSDLAYLYWEQGKYEEAESSLKRAMTIWQQQPDQEHAGAAECFHNLACVYQTQGMYKEAKPLLRAALGIDERVLGPEHSEVAIDLSNLAELYRVLGKYKDAESLLERALAIWEQLDQEHPQVAVCLHNLAHLYLEQGRYVQPEPFLKQALRCLESALVIHKKHLLNVEHPNSAIYYHNLAAIYQTQGKHEEAEALFLCAIDIKNRLFDPTHSSTAASLNELALLYLKQGRYADAEPLLRQAVTIRQQQLGKEHPDTVVCLHNLGLLYLGQGKYAQAKPLLEHALTIHKKLLGPEHPKTLLMQENGISLLRAMDQESSE